MRDKRVEERKRAGGSELRFMESRERKRAGGGVCARLLAGLLELGLQLLQLCLHACHLGGGRLQLLQANLVAPLQLHHLAARRQDRFR